MASFTSTHGFFYRYHWIHDPVRLLRVYNAIIHFSKNTAEFLAPLFSFQHLVPESIPAKV
jgi:hypothetical protein